MLHRPDISRVNDMGEGIPLWELLGAGTMLGGFVLIEFFLLSRIFRASLLGTVQKSSLSRLIQLIRTKGDQVTARSL